MKCILKAVSKKYGEFAKKISLGKEIIAVMDGDRDENEIQQYIRDDIREAEDIHADIDVFTVDGKKYTAIARIALRREDDWWYEYEVEEQP